MTAVYDKHGIRFLYPENWTLSEEQESPAPHVITVQSPRSGFISLHIYNTLLEPSELVTESLQVMRQEYDDLEVEQATERIGDVETVGYDMDFYYLDFVVTARSRSFCFGSQSFLVISQAETQEFEQLAPVFQAILVSLLRDENPGKS